MRGPKPKPAAPCPRCERIKKLKRGYCDSCYAVLLRKGEIKKLPRKKLPSKLTNLQEEVLVGSLLGDGCLYRRKETHLPYFVIQRTLGDKGYLEWQKNIFGDFVCSYREGKTFDKRTSNYYKWCKFTTHRNDLFVEHYNFWYANGEKKVPSEIELSPMILAVWFMDDGCVRWSTPNRIQLKLATHGFSYECVNLLRCKLEFETGERFTISFDNDRPVLYTADAGARAFAKCVSPCIPNCMLRKMTWL